MSPWPYTTKVEAVQTVVETFRRVVGPRQVIGFGSDSLGLGGASDGNDGVQWNTWVEYIGMAAWLGVNLEGLKYTNWPIATYISAEIADPELLRVMAKIQRRSEIRMLWWRDAWQGAGRLVRFKEHQIANVSLDQLDEPMYRKILDAALKCLDAKRGYQGRATQTVTLRSGATQRPVSPHFQFRMQLWRGVPDEATRTTTMAEAHATLAPLYDFVARRCA